MLYTHQITEDGRTVTITSFPTMGRRVGVKTGITKAPGYFEFFVVYPKGLFDPKLHARMVGAKTLVVNGETVKIGKR